MILTDTLKIFDNVSKRAKEKGMSINELEKRAGVSIGSTYKWNEVSPTMKNITKVANVLGCKVDDLIKNDTTQGVQ